MTKARIVAGLTALFALAMFADLAWSRTIHVWLALILAGLSLVLALLSSAQDRKHDR